MYDGMLVQTCMDLNFEYLYLVIITFVVIFGGSLYMPLHHNFVPYFEIKKQSFVQIRYVLTTTFKN